MPISVSPHLLELYDDDPDHFSHVFEYLFKPAIEAAGMEAVPPASKGSEIIHGDIVRNIERSDWVLCDISGLNPNVFFELGIRTAINKPAIMVRDNNTPMIPFDTNGINSLQYSSALEVWDLKAQIDRLNAIAPGQRTRVGRVVDVVS